MFVKKTPNSEIEKQNKTTIKKTPKNKNKTKTKNKQNKTKQKTKKTKLLHIFRLRHRKFMCIYILYTIYKYLTVFSRNFYFGFGDEKKKEIS